MKPITQLALSALLALTGLPAIALAQASPDPAASVSSGAEPAQRRVGVRELRQLANKAYAAGDYEAFREAVRALNQLRPWNADYMAYVVLAEALNENKAAAYEMMLTMQRQGLSHDFNRSPDSEFLHDTEAYEYINDLLVRQGEAAGEAEVLFELPADLLLPTAMEWDPSREAFLVANARDGAVFLVSDDGETETLLEANEENGLWGIFGMLVDAEANRLWLSSAANPNFSGFDEADAGQTALFEFELDSLDFVKRYPVPADGQLHSLGDLVKAGDGEVFAVDSVRPSIYRLEPGADALSLFVRSRDNVDFRGLTASDDGRLLYVADYHLGILALDLKGQKAIRLTGPDTLNFGGIEGLFFWDNHLVVIQNGIEPQRIMRLKLTPDRTGVEEVAPLAIAQPFFDYPNFGALQDDELVFFGNSHWVRNGEEPGPVTVAKTDVSQAPNLMAPDLDKFWDDYYESQGVERPDETQAGQ